MLQSAGILALSPYLENAGYLALLAFGFGFVVFWHELGHFLAAKWAGVRVEQFAVGFAHAVVSWRKGMGFRLGSSQREYKKSVYRHLGKEYPDKGEPTEIISDLQMREGGEALGLGETEYRLNWLPLGGYVKMLGQDDLRPNSEADDPKAYNRQSIGKRMVIVSAGVVMNVILAAIGFMILFSFGFNVAPTKVGSVLPNSPAQLAGVRVGDDIIQLDGRDLHNDQTKLQLNAALSASNQDIPIKVSRLMKDNSRQELNLDIIPAKADLGGIKLVGLGVGPYLDLATLSVEEGQRLKEIKDEAKHIFWNSRLLKPGDKITAVNGTAVGKGDYAVLDAHLQTGQTVTIEVTDKDGKKRQESFNPMFVPPFGSNQWDLLGMVPRHQVTSVIPDSPVFEKAQSGDILLEVRDGQTVDGKSLPTFSSLSKFVNDQAKADKKIRLTVLRDGKLVELEPTKPIEIRRGIYGVGIGMAVDDSAAVVAEAVAGSPAAAAGLTPKSTIKAVNGTAVANWRDVHTTIRKALPADATAATVELTYATDGGETKKAELKLSATDILAVRNVRYDSGLALSPTKEKRLASGLVQATQWGVIETRDFILQFYVTLQRMVTGDVSATNLMGPVGIFQTGTNIASKGPDWLIWFLSMISANLAVVNFLPIPIVDGGLFTFLLLEKIKGKPASPRTQMIAQYVGLVLLLSIFVFVTWQDIANFKFR
ncbi:site-2 protease family protein [Humisphaera borealis]|uniref:Site-2 protease family protein n=1 Tax=Humisphaera borealis TaxID=2807512 RepID=A0A7M2WPT3_9BACT|nr:site-2 protease family protein [Humisphaera borealis]QOV87478.1 site-2 protease family protein [Humisphaera borealis]